MMNRILVVFFLAGLAGSQSALAAGGGDLEQAQTDMGNIAAIQRGARFFVNYCQGCHSAQYMRYSRLQEDLGLTEAQVEQNLIFSDAKVGETMFTAMAADDQQAWFGAAAPDLSLTSRSRGADWLYTYLKSFYIDESRPLGWNNKLFANVSMPHVLWELQGIQEPVYETQLDERGDEVEVLVGLKKVSEGTMSEAEYAQTILDLVTFLEYMGEPAKLKRESLGVWVILYLALFTFLAYLLKAEFWRDIK